MGVDVKRGRGISGRFNPLLPTLATPKKQFQLPYLNRFWVELWVTGRSPSLEPGARSSSFGFCPMHPTFTAYSKSRLIKPKLAGGRPTRHRPWNTQQGQPTTKPAICRKGSALLCAWRAQSSPRTADARGACARVCDGSQPLVLFSKKKGGSSPGSARAGGVAHAEHTHGSRPGLRGG